MTIVTRSRVKSAPSKEEATSAPNAGPPVTSIDRPSGRSRSISERSDPMTSAVSLLSAPTVIGTIRTAASLSSLTSGPEAGSASSPRRGSRPSSAARSSASSAFPSSRVTTICTDWRSAPGKVARSFETREDSESSGACALRDGASAPAKSPKRATNAARTRPSAIHAPRREVRRSAKDRPAGFSGMVPTPPAQPPPGHRASGRRGHQPFGRCAEAVSMGRGGTAVLRGLCPGGPPRRAGRSGCRGRRRRAGRGPGCRAGGQAAAPTTGRR